jgi:SAM-dependent MidA family methyltransferase
MVDHGHGFVAADDCCWPLGNAAGQMTPLQALLRRRIELVGPVSIAEYMTECLFHPEHGYYTTREPFGAKGDFTTAPEISQMFGEIIAAWWLSARDAIGMPDMRLCEIGPGRGTLMDDMLRTMHKLTGALPPVHMVESSPRLTAMQQTLLSKHDAVIRWHSQVSGLPPAPIGIVANELFDAIPIRQFMKTQGRWLERMVYTEEAGALAFMLGHNELETTLLPSNHESAQDGSIFEYAPARMAMMHLMADHLKSHGGFALLIDYGHASSGLGDTLQAVRAHEYVGIFDRPGESDLTSHVDFEALVRIARSVGLFASEILTQGEFLLGAGIAQRAAQFPAKAGPRAALDRLTASDQMGSLFKVLAIASHPFDAYPLKFDH